MRKTWLFTAILSLCLCQAALADELSAQKRADILRLMEVTGSGNLGLQMAEAFSKNAVLMIKTLQPKVPDRALEAVRKEIMDLVGEKMSGPGGLMEQVLPIYDRNLTHQDIRDILAFYETSAGRKTIQVMPQIMRESMQAGEKLGKTLGPEIERRVSAALKREGVQLKVR